MRSTATLLLPALGLASPTVRELTEMLYEFDEPFVVDSTEIATRLGVAPTPSAEGIAHTRRSYR